MVNYSSPYNDLIICKDSGYWNSCLFNCKIIQTTQMKVLQLSAMNITHRSDVLVPFG